MEHWAKIGQPLTKDGMGFHTNQTNPNMISCLIKLPERSFVKFTGLKFHVPKLVLLSF